MSCNGCKILRKRCSESCILRPCLQWIRSPESQGHATVFVAKFFGRAGLMAFISNVPDSQRPALFQSLLYEACARTVNPVNGAVGLLWTGNWHLCQAAVDTVLRGGTLRPLPEFHNGMISDSTAAIDSDEAFEVICPPPLAAAHQLDLSLTPATAAKKPRRPPTPTDEEEEYSGTTTAVSLESGFTGHHWGRVQEARLLNLFV